MCDALPSIAPGRVEKLATAIEQRTERRGPPTSPLQGTRKVEVALKNAGVRRWVGHADDHAGKAALDRLFASGR
jgi:hypothetical protein